MQELTAMIELNYSMQAGPACEKPEKFQNNHLNATSIARPT